MKKKLLIVVPEIPYPLNAGGKIAQFEFIEQLRHVFDITMVFILSPKEHSSYDELKLKWPNINFKPYLTKGSKDLIKSFSYKIFEILFQQFGKRFMLSKAKTDLDRILAINSMLFRSRGFVLPINFKAHFKGVLAADTYDYVQVEFHHLITFAKYIPASIKKIFIHHELRFIREQREVELYSYDSKYLQLLQSKNAEFELQELNRYDLICTLSKLDQEYLQEKLDKPIIYTSPIPIKLNQTIPHFSFNNKIIFLGGEYHSPNKDGLNWFLNFCWADLVAGNSDLRLIVIGKWTSETIDLLTSKHDSIEFKGFVDDLDAEMQNGILITPIRIGSGIRIKILEAINLGVPVVTTTVGVEGLNFQHNVDCLVEDDPVQFVSCINKIVQNNDLGELLVTNAKSKLILEYDFDNLIKKRIDMYDLLNEL